MNKPAAPARKLRLVVLGMMGRCPFGGQTWLYLNWLRAFSSLGHDVWYVEDDPSWPFDPDLNSPTDDCRYALRHIAHSMERIGLQHKWVFRLANVPGKCWGLDDTGLDDLFRSCDAILNIVGATNLREEHMAAPRRIYVQTDPVTAELRLANGDAHTAAAFAAHDTIITYAENYGNTDCGVPLNGIRYKKTRQPVDLDLWPAVTDPNSRYFTTIGNYRQSGSDVEYQGDTYFWSKHHEWEKIIDLPRHTTQEFELALNVAADGDQRRLEQYGWRIVSPYKMSLDVFGTYPSFFRHSRAEISVAKDQNVRLRSGWFSERDVCYLASGKPIVSQETGFSNILPTGAGLFCFSDKDEALAAVEAINGDYERHCRAARRLAEDYFAAPKVGAQFLRDVGLA